MNDYYVYLYCDTAEEINLDVDFKIIKYKPIYVGKGKGDRLNHSSKFLHLTTLKVGKFMEDLTNRQAEFIESYLIDKIGIENLNNKKSGNNLYLLENLEDNDIFEYVKLLGSY